METTPTKPSEVTGREPQTSTQPQPQTSTTFQSIEDGLKEWDAQDAINAQLGIETGGGSKKTKKSKAKAEKPVADLNAWVAEQKAKEELGDVENWIGKLLEYRNANPKANGLFYTESLDGSAQRFKCTATISESSTPFGGQSFSNKKDAKRYAAKKAIDYLIANKYMPSDGSVRFPKQIQPVNPPRDTSVPSFAAQVPDICYKLGISPPTYKLEKSQQRLGIWNVYALFEGVSWIDGRVGELENVFGQKKAKEQCAEQVILFLKDVERQRNVHTIYSPPIQNPTTTTPINSATANSTSNSTSSSPPTTPSTRSASATAQINTLCPLLGFRQPTYVLNKAQDNISMYSGYAYFDGDPRTPAKIGEFWNVYSKKGAKEKCAESVLAFLRGVERERLEAARSFMSGVKSSATVEVGEEDLDEEEKKRKRVSLDAAEKMVKQKLEKDVKRTEGAVVDKRSEVLEVVA